MNATDRLEQLVRTANHVSNRQRFSKDAAAEILERIGIAAERAQAEASEILAAGARDTELSRIHNALCSLEHLGKGKPRSPIPALRRSRLLDVEARRYYESLDQADDDVDDLLK